MADSSIGVSAETKRLLTRLKVFNEEWRSYDDVVNALAKDAGAEDLPDSIEDDDERMAELRNNLENARTIVGPHTNGD